MPADGITVPRVSLVIPAFNEEHYLPALLDSAEIARRQFHRGPDAVEFIVADNASTDRTAEIARSRGCHVVHVTKRSIAAARNGGAKVARGEVLAFIDADSQIHPQTFNAIERTLASGKVIVGATGLSLSRTSPALAFMLLVFVPIAKLARLDAGVVFCRREDWETIGGYREELLVGEDVRFLLDMKRLGRRRGQRFARAKGVKAITSTRKFDKHGDWRFLMGMVLSPFLWLFRPQVVERWARRHWYEDRA
jgi:glycosyltransferase involved in cell wall biosynthesis